MAKNMNARIAHKHDTLENWKKATGFIPMLGEFFLVDDISIPLVLGDGETSADQLVDYPLFQAIGDEEIEALFSEEVKDNA